MSVRQRVGESSVQKQALPLLLCWGLVAMLVLSLGTTLSAQDKKDKDKEVDSKTILSPADGWPLKLTYYRSAEGKEAPVVVLLHMKGESRLTWTAPKGFAEQLHARGFAVLAVDMRKHGQSKPGADADDPKKAASSEKDKAKKSTSGSELKPTDYPLMVRDMDGVKKFIYEEHQKGNLNMRKTAIIAPTMSAAIAIAFAAADWQKAPYDDAANVAMRTPRGQDVQAMVFLSPETTLPGVPAHQVVSHLKATPMAAFVVVGGSDAQDKDQAKKLFQQLGGDPAKTEAPKKKTEPKKPGKEKEPEKASDKKGEERFFYGELKGVKLRGTDLLGKNLQIEEAMTSFLEDHVKALKGPVYEWRDRQSRLND
jgi:alpha-beta hydrolase superfamily lysophospholipase